MYRFAKDKNQEEPLNIPPKYYHDKDVNLNLCGHNFILYCTVTCSLYWQSITLIGDNKENAVWDVWRDNYYNIYTYNSHGLQVKDHNIPLISLRQVSISP